MADYYPVMLRAISELDPEATGEPRRARYERARVALVAELHSVQPLLPESDIQNERLALERAIRYVVPVMIFVPTFPLKVVTPDCVPVKL